jgi:hypothetical protein
MAYTDIDKPSDYFNTKLYTGTGSSLAITGVGFQPDWIWFKERGATRSHALVDSVRGRNKVVFADLNNAEETSAASTNDLKSFDSDGFTVGVTNVSGSFNTDSGSHVAWNWKAGTSFTNDASSTGIGSIDSAGSFNNDSGFSIVSYTNTNQSANSGVATIKHGLNTTPNVLILKDRDATSDWQVFHSSLPTNKYLDLNTTDAAAVDTNVWNNTAPTSSVFTVGDNSYSNPANRAMIAYCFAEKKGYSKFGSYTGNGDADGTMVYTGFKPAWTLIKRTDSTTGGSWILFDNKRGANVINPVDVVLAASNNQSEADWGTAYDCDYLSNGFKWRHDGSSGYVNVSGASYIYMAFAENPFVTSTGVPATAR